jgi:hypothetical protein
VLLFKSDSSKALDDAKLSAFDLPPACDMIDADEDDDDPGELSRMSFPYKATALRSPKNEADRASCKAAAVLPSSNCALALR